MTHRSNYLNARVSGRLLLVVLAFALPSLALAQTNKQKQAAVEDPIFTEYRGVQIGWLADDVRKKLGDPASKGDEQDFYMFGEKESAQFQYDKATKKVVAISVDFMNGASTVITPEQVFGSDIEAKPDGSKWKLIRYPKAGCWVSYSRTAGNTPIITVTIQKITTAQ
ncbi:MAG TPA: hypothetical protein VLA93_10535 [Pyrinomonadaceae bacterium]|nr:hypothetical protein [Pyrinomonadaceae bacterium]